MVAQLPFLFEAPQAPAPLQEPAAPAVEPTPAPSEPPPAPAPAGRHGRPSKARPAMTPIEELGDPADIAAEICGTLGDALDVMGRMERELAAGPGPVEPPPQDDDPWIVFVQGSVNEPPPPAALHRARARYAAEYEVSRALGIAEKRCFAVPFGAVLGDAAVPLESHPLRLPDPPAENLGDMIKAEMERQIRRSDEDMAATKDAHAKLLGCSVEELEQRLADQRAEAAREKAKQRAAKPSRSAPKGAPVPPPTPGGPSTGMRRLTPRQQELLALVAVEDQRVIYLPDNQVPDWAALKMCVESLGGTWRSASKKKRGGWIFPDDVDVAEVIRLAQESGEIFDAKLVGFIQTPELLADHLVAPLVLQPGDTALEPSAGAGRLGDALRRIHPGVRVICVELLDENREILEAAGYELIGRDFLTVDPMTVDPVAAVAMNSPFANGAEVHHITHAMRFLREGGTLAAIASAGVKHRSGALYTGFRAMLDRHHATVEDLPDGSFGESGTMVRTVMIRLTKGRVT